MSSCKNERAFKSKEFCILHPILTNYDNLTSFNVIVDDLILSRSEQGSKVCVLVLIEVQLSSPGLFVVNGLFYCLYLQGLSFTNLKTMTLSLR